MSLKRTPIPRLLPRQKKFAMLVASGVTPTVAARDAGYQDVRAADTAWRLLCEDRVRETIKAYRIVGSHAFAAEAGLFWDSLMEAMLESQDMKERLAATKMVGDALGAFDRDNKPMAAVAEPQWVALKGEE